MRHGQSAQMDSKRIRIARQYQDTEVSFRIYGTLFVPESVCRVVADSAFPKLFGAPVPAIERFQKKQLRDSTFALCAEC